MQTNNAVQEIVELPNALDLTNNEKKYVSVSRQFLDTIKRYPEIEIFGKDWSYKYYMMISGVHNPLLSRLAASGIPLSSALSLVTKLLSDVCRVIDTIVTSIMTGEFAIGNMPLLLVDAVEYVRLFMGIVFGIFAAWYSPQLATKTFLINPVDSSINFLDTTEAAHLYSLADLLHNFFIKHKIDYRICSGTALGARREGGIIRNDDDIDLMLHPDSKKAFKALIDNGTFAKETGCSIKAQSSTGGWQVFYADSPKGRAGTPLEDIGSPYVDIFPGAWRQKGNQKIVSYEKEIMYNVSRGDYFTTEEWDEPPELYSFGPTKLYGVKSIEQYLTRSYGPLALKYTALLYPHGVYSNIYASPLSTLSILSQNATPRYMRHVQKAPLDFDKAQYDKRILQWMNNNRSADQQVLTEETESITHHL